MTLYVDTSALMKRYIEERDSDVATDLMATDPILVTSRLTEIEMCRNLTRLLEGTPLTDTRRQLQADLDAFALVALDASTCNEAVRNAEQTLWRSVDSIHIASARRAVDDRSLLSTSIRRPSAQPPSSRASYHRITPTGLKPMFAYQAIAGSLSTAGSIVKRWCPRPSKR